MLVKTLLKIYYNHRQFNQNIFIHCSKIKLIFIFQKLILNLLKISNLISKNGILQISYQYCEIVNQLLASKNLSIITKLAPLITVQLNYSRVHFQLLKMMKEDYQFHGYPKTEEQSCSILTRYSLNHINLGKILILKY